MDCAYSQSSDSNFYRKSWAVVIGINKYQEWPGLEYAVNDARSVKEQLEKRGFKVIYLEDEQATRQNITRLLWDELPGKLKWDDRILIFFAGHGDTEQIDELTKMGYIVPVDATPGIRSTAISMEWIRQLSQKLIAKHVYYVFDACYSGLGLRSSRSLIWPADVRSSKDTSDDTKSYFDKMTKIRAVQMITAGGQGEEVVEECGHGLFTKYFLEALDGAADRIPQDGVVTTGELGVFLRPTVSTASNNRQTPQYGTLEGEGEVVFMLPSDSISSPTQPLTITPTPMFIIDPVHKAFENLQKNIQIYKELIEQEEQGIDVEFQIIQVLINLVNESKNIEEIWGFFPEKKPELTERIQQFRELMAEYKKELSERLSH